MLGEARKHTHIVELVFDDQDYKFQHLPNHTGLRTNTVVWQKEALLNLGIRQLLKLEYPKIAWFDGDIQFNSPEWYNEISDSLDKYNLIQAFRAVRMHETALTCRVVKSTIASIGNVSPATGFAWAAKASMFDDMLLYDKLIVGGGDTLIYSAAMGTLGEWLRKRSGTYRHTAHIVEWANKWYEKVGGSIGYAETMIETFFHGNLRKRNYLNRHEILKTSSFDPVKHIITDPETGLLEWTDEAEDGIREDIRRYFVDRKEDS